MVEYRMCGRGRGSSWRSICSCWWIFWLQVLSVPLHSSLCDLKLQSQYLTEVCVCVRTRSHKHDNWGDDVYRQEVRPPFVKWTWSWSKQAAEDNKPDVVLLYNLSLFFSFYLFIPYSSSLTCIPSSPAHYTEFHKFSTPAHYPWPSPQLLSLSYSSVYLTSTATCKKKTKKQSPVQVGEEEAEKECWSKSGQREKCHYSPDHTLKKYSDPRYMNKNDLKRR